MTIVQLLIIFAILYCLQQYFTNSVVLKTVTATYLFFVASAIYFSLETYKGWPTIEKAERGVITSIIIDDPTEDTDGAIYIWVRNSDSSLKWYQFLGNDEDNNEPRSFALPYTKQTAKTFREAKKSLEEGKVVLIQTDDDQESDVTTNDGKDAKGKSGSIGDVVKNYNVPHLKIVEPRELLKKEGPQ